MIAARPLKGILALALFTGGIPNPARAQVAVEVEWQRCIGGSGSDRANSTAGVYYGEKLSATSDGGFICMGQSLSVDGDAAGAHGDADILVAKLDAEGTMQWGRMLGGSALEFDGSCFEASDGSIMVMGYTYSNDGDVAGNHGDRDLWVLKLSPLGSIIWQHAYGGSGMDFGTQVQETADGGFVVTGTTYSFDGDITGFHPGPGTGDGWVLKMDPAGNVEWSRAYGGLGMDAGLRLIQTADGGFLLMNHTGSNDGDVLNYHGGEDCWLLKLNAAGDVLWSRAVGGGQRDVGFSAMEMDNGDIMLLGSTESNDGDMPLNRGGYDVFLAKLSASGQLIWVKTYGGSLDDEGRSLLATPEGGFIIGGGSRSNDGDLSINHGWQDIWTFKVDANGVLSWQRSFGGSFDDWADLYETDQSGYLLSGGTLSTDGDSQGSHGNWDLWLAMLSTDGDLLWHRCIGGSHADFGSSPPLQTWDGGYVLFGNTDSNDGDVSGNHGQSDLWVAKVKVINVPPSSECALFIPNAFSPDNSTRNDLHCLYGTDCIATMQLGIYDRWGTQVFSSTDPQACWDGTYNGQPLDPAVFVYHLSATLHNGESVERQGNITLMK